MMGRSCVGGEGEPGGSLGTLVNGEYQDVPLENNPSFADEFCPSTAWDLWGSVII